MRKTNDKFFLISFFIFISFTIAKAIFIIFSFGLLIMLPKSDSIALLVAIIAISLAIFSGVSCFKWMNTKYNRSRK